MKDGHWLASPFAPEQWCRDLGSGLRPFCDGTMKQTGDASLRLRAGILVTPWTLIYATGDAAVGDISGSFAYAAHENPSFFDCGGLPTTCASVTGGQSWSDVRTGWTAGGGIEFLVLPNVTLRVKYRYTGFGFYQKHVPLSWWRRPIPDAGPCGRS